MDYRRRLEAEHTKHIWTEIIKDVGSDADKFSELMELFFCEDIVLIQRSSQTIGVIGEKQPQLIKPYLLQLVEYLNESSLAAVKRNVLRIFQFIEIPQNVEGELFDIVLKLLKSADEPIAVKAFSMTVLRRICEKHPELTQEVVPTIELLLEENTSPGIVSRGRKELKILSTITS